MKKMMKSVVPLTALSLVVAPVAIAISCGTTKDSVDLANTIVVLAADHVNYSTGVVTHPMVEVWNEAIKKWKEDYPEDAKKFNVKIRNLPYDQYNKLATVGVTGQAIPDIWYFPTDKLYLLKTQNRAIAPMSEYVDKQIASVTGIQQADILHEQLNGDNYAARFKSESVLMWMNTERLDQIYTKAEDMINDLMLAKVDNSTKQVTLSNYNTVLPKTQASATLQSVDLSPSEWFDAFKGTGSSEKQRKNIADFMYKALDVKKVADVMASAKNSWSSSNTQEKEKAAKLMSLLPIEGYDYWRAIPVAYSVGEVEENGLIWDDNGKLKTQLTSLLSDTKIKTVWEAYYNLATKSNAVNKDYSKKDFMSGLQAFNWSGTWFQKDFAQSGIDEDHLFSFPLAQINGNQMRHYLQGWDFGINSRNKVDSTKYKATGDLLAEVFSNNVQELFYQKVEHYIPGNMQQQVLKTISGSTSNNFILPSMQLIENNKNTLVADVQKLPKEYNENKFDELILTKIFNYLKKDASGNVSSKNYEDWAKEVVNFLKMKGYEA